ncbi:glutathione S-transferase omega-1-like [Glandiceps talaboti]
MSGKHLTTGDECPPLKADTLRVYNMRFCPYAQRAILALRIKEIPHEEVLVNTRNKPAWFFDKNPSGLVPVLEKNNKIVYESSICVDYLDELYTDNPLMSSDPYQRAQDRMLFDFFNSKIHSVYWKSSIAKGKDEETKKLILDNLDKMESELKKRNTPFFGGQQIGWLDVQMWPFFERIEGADVLGDGKCLPVDRFPTLTAWITKTRDVPAVKNYLIPPDVLRMWSSKYRTDEAVFDGLV